MIIDTEGLKSVKGVVIQGRSLASGNTNQIVTKIKLAYSADETSSIDEVTWTDVEDGREFDTGVQPD
jgi:hypothetical protein